MKYIILILLALIIYNLTAGFFYIIKDKKSSKRGFHSLKTRIILSLLLFATLIIGYYLDLIQPHGIWLITNRQKQISLTIQHQQSANTKQLPQNQSDYLQKNVPSYI